MTGLVRASVLVPTHSHHTTLPMTVRSVLAQTMTDLEVLIIGDGVDQATRDAAEALQAADPRVRFLDLPKGEHHGEAHRHTAIGEAKGEVIAYLCDDDLLLPDHVGDMVALLDDHDFAQSLNGWFDSSGRLRLFATDLSSVDAVAWHLLEPRRNRVSLTGTAHTRSAYDGLDDPWEPTPAGQWPDHHMWKKFFRVPGLRAVTSARMTALQFPTSADGRLEWSDEQRAREIEPWAHRVSLPGAQDEIDALVAQAMHRELDDVSRSHDLLTRDHARMMKEIAHLTARNAAMTAEIERFKPYRDDLLEQRTGLRARVEKLLRLKRRAEARLQGAELELEQARARILAMEASRSWRLTRPLRGARRAGRGTGRHP